MKKSRDAIAYLDAPRLLRALTAGIGNVFQRREYLNRINVFPVPDGDTGTNMAFTFKTILEATANSPDERVDELMDHVAEAALDGARGNSGAIMAQYFHGFREAVAGGQGFVDLIEGIWEFIEHGKLASAALFANPGADLRADLTGGESGVGEHRYCTECVVERAAGAGAIERGAVMARLEQLDASSLVVAGGQDRVLIAHADNEAGAVVTRQHILAGHGRVHSCHITDAGPALGVHFGPGGLIVGFMPSPEVLAAGQAEMR